MSSEAQHISKRRRARDRVATVAINTAGIAVIVLILLILAYLLFVAMPLTEKAKILDAQSMTLNADADHVVAESNGRLWQLRRHDDSSVLTRRLLSQGDRAAQLRGESVHLYDLRQSSQGLQQAEDQDTARWLMQVALPGLKPDSLVFDSVADRVLIGFASEDGSWHALWITDPGSSRVIQRRTLRLPAQFADAGSVLIDARSGEHIHIHGNEFLRWSLAEENPAAGTTRGPDEEPVSQVALEQGTFDGLAVDVEGRAAWGPGRETVLFVAVDGQLHRFDPARPALPALGTPLSVLPDANRLWSEARRRVVYLASPEGEVEILAPSSGDTLYRGRPQGLQGVELSGVSSDGAYLYSLSETRYTRWAISNPFPESGWRSLWRAQWYGAYDGPQHVWHPDGEAIDVLSKYGLTPLLFGTFKAALYGLLLSIPIALGAAIYTGYILSPRRRNQFKPTIELLEAFPTVVLGFIAGLWLAPLLLDYLAVILLLPLIVLGLPLLFALLHLVLQFVSLRFASRPPRAWLMTVAYAAVLGGCLMHSDALQQWMFDDSPTDWIWETFGLRYDQRNALLVGLAMGVAITPAMFSIVEDAIFAVPRELSDGSLALGATRWQSLAYVVIPAASPAILSALLIGLARGLGETMIVLLATGNTPLMQSDLFSGLRSLSASIVAELPEAGASSVHFRVLFLAALVLFGLTFLLNTVAELFRQRLRYAYSSR